ncbi:Integrase, catalytic core [Gossypium australe]|uniref:Integrase, catalytic core n=1 Tax=Gossypium australe TaxID=47621 RepID=A0A5B6USR2_9ROSI|nr:Integrase, catalytic core [Gossypium australe]
MCVDCQDFDKASSKNNFPLPHIDTLVDNTVRHSLFSFMDGFSEYNQIKTHPDDMEKTTFVIMWGMAKSGKLLGFVVSEKGIEIDPDKFNVIQELPPSCTQKEVWGFLGKLNYIARFISQLTEECDPIFCLLKKHNPSVWDDKCHETFDKANIMSQGGKKEQSITSARILLKARQDIRQSRSYDDNHMADALATLVSMIKVNKQDDLKPIQMSICEALAYFYNIKEEERDDYPWDHHTLQYVKNRKYPTEATTNDKRTLRRMANEYVLDEEILYKRRKDQVLLRCVDTIEAKKILEEVHEGVCEAHANDEASNKNMKRIVGKMIETYKDRHKKLPFSLYAYRTSVRTSMGAIPFSLVYGMETVLPFEVEISSL